MAFKLTDDEINSYKQRRDSYKSSLSEEPVVATSDFSTADAEDDYLYKRAAQAEDVANEEKRKLIQNEDYMSKLRYFMRDRFKEDGKQREDESDEVFHDRYTTHMRWATNNSASLMKEIDYIRGASPEARHAYGEVYQKWDAEAPALYDMSAGDAADGLGDYLVSTAADPLNWLQTIVAGVATGGPGAIAAMSAKQIASRAALKKVLTTTVLGQGMSKHILRGTLSHGALGAAQGAVEDAMLQHLEQKAYLEQDDDGNLVFDPTISEEERTTDINRVLKQAGLGAVLGAGEGFLTGRQARKSTISYANAKLRMAGAQEKLNKNLDIINNEGRIVDAVTFDPVQGDQTNDLLKAIDIDSPDAKPLADKYEELRQNVNAYENSSTTMAAINQAELDAVGTVPNADSLIQAQLRVSVVQQLDKIATGVFKVKTEEYANAMKQGLELKDDALFNLIEGIQDKQATDITRDIMTYIVKDIKDEDFDVLERALHEANVTKGDFLDILSTLDAKGSDGNKVIDAVSTALRQTKSDAGRTLGSGGALGRARKAFFGLDKDTKAKLDKLFGAGDPTTQALMGINEFFQKTGRVRRGLMVINPATTVRNIFSGATNVTFNTASNTMESVFYNMGKAITGQQAVGKSLHEIWLDSSNLLMSMVQPSNALGEMTGGLSMQKARLITDAALINNPTIAKRIMRSTHNFDGDGSMPGFVTFLNGLNVAQDAFFRRNIFAYELDKAFRRSGVDGGVYDVLANGKNIPVNILQEVSAKTMKGTFSYAPRRNKGVVENTAAKTLDFIEAFPMGTVALPFARFMMNAMAFQFKYSPFNVATNSFQALAVAATRGRKEVNLSKLNASFADSTVGTAALLAAMQIRSDNQDQPYYNMRVGGTIVDTRPLFPVAPYLMLADLLFKFDAFGVEQFNDMIAPDKINKAPITVKELAEGMAGINLKSSAQLPLFDALLGFGQANEEGSMIGEEKTAQNIGRTVAEYANSFLVGGNFVKDVIAAFDGQEATIRDYNAAIEGTGGMERGLSAASQTLKKSIPVSLQSAVGLEVAPARSFAYRSPGEVAYRDSSLLKQTMGVTTVRPPTDVEAEMAYLGYDEWKVFRGSGDKAADNYTRRGASEFASGLMQNVMSLPEYKNLKHPEKRIFIGSLMTKVQKEARVLGENFMIEDYARKYDEVKKQTDTAIQAILKKDGDVTDSNEETINKLFRKQLLYKNFLYTGPFARFRWLERTDKKLKSTVNARLADMKQAALTKRENGEELADYEKLLILAPRPSVESSGLYGLGYEIAKVIKRELKA